MLESKIASLVTHQWISYPKAQDPTLYRSLAGALQYLTFTRHDICYVVQQICLFMHDPRESHHHAIRRIFHYIQGTKKNRVSKSQNHLHLSWHPTQKQIGQAFRLQGGPHQVTVSFWYTNLMVFKNTSYSLTFKLKSWV